MPGLEYDVSFRTHLALRRIKEVSNLAEMHEQDPEKTRRIQSLECIPCFYRTRIAGQAFTPYTCEICASVQNWHNTATPRMCDSCAQKHSLCKRCGADRELDETRKQLIKTLHIPYVSET